MRVIFPNSVSTMLSQDPWVGVGTYWKRLAIGVPQLGKFVFPLLGEGRVNWKQFFEALEEIEYDGFCSLEFESFRFYRQVLKNDPKRPPDSCWNS